MPPTAPSPADFAFRPGLAESAARLRAWVKRRPRRFVLALGVALVTGLTAVLALPLAVADTGLIAGGPSPRTILASRDLRFSSRLQTERRRADAEAAVAPVYKPKDMLITAAQVGRARAVLDQVAALRVATDVTRAAALLALAEVPELQAPGAGPSDLGDALLGLDDVAFDEVRAEVPAVVNATLRVPVRADSLSAARGSTIANVKREIGQANTELIADLAGRFVVPNSLLDEAATAAARTRAREEVAPVEVAIARGQAIMAEGEIIDENDYEVLQALGVVGQATNWLDVLALFIGILTLVATTAGTLWRLAPKALLRPRHVLVAVVVILAYAVGARFFVGQRVLSLAFPTAAVAMTLSIVAGIETGVLSGILMAAVVAIMTGATGDPLEVALYVAVASLAGAVSIGRAEKVKSFLVATVAVLAANVAVLILFRLPDASIDVRGIVELGGATVANATLSSALTALNVIAAGILLQLATPLQLLELARPDNALLRRLQMEAPGTYQHSVVLSNLAERAADLIGADPILVRVGTYYHDIGKVRRPYFFVENQVPGTPNPHHDLEPTASARIIVEHVTAGAEMARLAGLPDSVIDFIRQHHGTTRVEYFYRQAVAELGIDGIDDAAFRYPGPRPQSREIALVMLADSAEASVRAAAPQSDEEIEQIVHGVVDRRLSDGELDDCDLTLRDLQRIADSFVATLKAMYHPRVRYPKAVDGEPVRRRSRAGGTPGAPGTPESS